MAPVPPRQAASPATAPRPAGAKVPKKTARWRDLLPRVASAMVLGPIALGAAWQGGLAWEALLTLLAAIAVLEWTSLCGVKLDSGLAIIAAASIPAAQAVYLATSNAWLPAVVIAVLGAVVALRNRLLSAGILYVGAGWIGLLLIRAGMKGPESLLFLLLVVWANDIGAYIAGRLIGGRRMAPSLSPGKTWAGAGGGVVLAVITGLAVAAYTGASHAGQYRAEGIALVLAVVAQVGDLMESALKRHTGAKDSGQLIPGHGGVLDRVDGLLAAAAITVLWQLAWRGATLWQ